MHEGIYGTEPSIANGLPDTKRWDAFPRDGSENDDAGPSRLVVGGFAGAEGDVGGEFEALECACGLPCREVDDEDLNRERTACQVVATTDVGG